jgi:hypothetical protein
MPSQTFIRPAAAKPTNKRPEEMSIEELRQAADAQALEFYRDKANADPSNVAAREEYKNYCLTRGLDPATGKRSRFENMTREEIAAEWTAQGKAIEDTELDGFRSQQAKVWMASRPEYEATPANAACIEAEINRLGVRGNVYEFDQAFWTCVRRGEIVPVEQIVPVALPTRDECFEMPLEELKRLAEQTSR